MTRQQSKIVWLLALLANAALLWPTLPAIQVAAALLLSLLLPGLLLVRLWAPRAEGWQGALERIVYAVAAGIGVQVVTLLLLSYIPGPLTKGMALAAFDGILIVLGVVRHADVADRRACATQTWQTARSTLHASRSTLFGLLILLLTAGALRFVDLGYADFDSDEARATLRAAAVIQGYDDVLFIHRKGPTEILVPTALYVLTGHLTEGEARLPFALANLAGVLAIFLLGWRCFGPVAGWSGAMLLAVDGYYVAFARFVQYQSVVFLTSAATVLILYRFYQATANFQDQDASDPPHPISYFLSPTSYLLLAAWLLATGLLSHYEAALAAIPAGYLLLAAWRSAPTRAGWRKPILAATVAGAIPLALFYVPFTLNPNFAATVVYIAEDRVGGGMPYNNVLDFVQRTFLYNSIYAIVLTVGLALIALIALYMRGAPGWGGRALAVAACLLLMLTIWNDRFLAFGGADLLALPWTLLLLAAWMMPRQETATRAILLWWTVPMLLAWFAIARPLTHVYTFFPAWMLLVGWTIEMGWQRLRRWQGPRRSAVAGGMLAASMIGLLAFYPYTMFIGNPLERAESYGSNLPAIYWQPFSQSPSAGVYGLPMANGWRVVRQLYQAGEIAGDYESTHRWVWLPFWYSNGQRRCEYSAQWLFEMQELQPSRKDPAAFMESYLRGGFQLWGTVEVRGKPRLRIYQRADRPISPRTLPADEGVSLPATALALDYPVVTPRIGHPLRADLGHEIWLEGYDVVAPPTLRPGDAFALRLYWRAQKSPTRSYTVFNQVRADDGAMIAQFDSTPVCGTLNTDRWNPGELIADSYILRVNLDARPGAYAIYSGMYDYASGARLEILDDAGQPIANEVRLGTVEVR
jgi:hypothetical protein